VLNLMCWSGAASNSSFLRERVVGAAGEVRVRAVTIHDPRRISERVSGRVFEPIYNRT
jgi:hypothetical protein